MNCPQCGKELESGFMDTYRNYVTWTQQENLPLLRAPKDLLILTPLDDPSTLDSLADRDLFPRYPAMLCRNCGLTVFPCNMIPKFKDKK